MDILVGDVWYEGPDWKKVHEIRKPGNYGNGANGYSQSFACWAEDLNGDGWPDLIVIGFPGAPCHWFENPKGKPGHWKQHEIWHSACNETPQYVDLFGTGLRVLIMGYQSKEKGRTGQMAYFTPGQDPTRTWTMHPISELGTADTFRVSADTLKKLRADKVADDTVKKLEGLQDQTFASPGELLAAASKRLSKEEMNAV